MTTKNSEAVERVFAEDILEQSRRLNICPGTIETPMAWANRVRKAAILEALTAPTPADDVVEQAYKDGFCEGYAHYPKEAERNESVVDAAIRGWNARALLNQEPSK